MFFWKTVFFQKHQFLQWVMLSFSKTTVFTMNYAAAIFIQKRSFWSRTAGVSRAEPSRAGAEPGRAGPSRAEPSRAGPGRAEPSRAQPSGFEPIRAKPSQAEPSRRRPTRHIFQKQQFLQWILHFYTLFKNNSFYNEFGYFAIKTTVFTMNLITCFNRLQLLSKSISFYNEFCTFFKINSFYNELYIF